MTLQDINAEIDAAEKRIAWLRKEKSKLLSPFKVGQRIQWTEGGYEKRVMTGIVKRLDHYFNDYEIYARADGGRKGKLSFVTSHHNPQAVQP